MTRGSSSLKKLKARFYIRKRQNYNLTKDKQPESPDDGTLVIIINESCGPSRGAVVPSSELSEPENKFVLTLELV